jgi:Family of unknown function (DUF6516)
MGQLSPRKALSTSHPNRGFWVVAGKSPQPIIEITVHQVLQSPRYPDGLKWGLICFDRKSKKRVLFDNHHPKGPHRHLNEQELPYTFVDLNKLVEDFKETVLNHMGVRL